MPLFAWAMLVTAFMIMFAFTTLVVGSLLLELSRSFDMKFFDPEFGGSSLLWQHLFWIFGHPEVYIQFLPAAGVVSMIIPVFVRRKIAGYGWLVAAFVAIGFMSFALWAHHMFTVGLPPVVSASSRPPASPSACRPASRSSPGWPRCGSAGRCGRRRCCSSTGFIVTFVIGGITGVMVASAPFDLQAHDSYFVVGHLHYVLIGGVAFPIFAAAYYWLPKFTGKLLSERLGKFNFWLMFVGLNVTFFPMHIAGLLRHAAARVHLPRGGPAGGSTTSSRRSAPSCSFAGIAGVHRQPPLQPLSRRSPPATTRGAPTRWSGRSRRRRPTRASRSRPSCTAATRCGTRTTCTRGEPRPCSPERGLAQWPLTWRAALVTGTNDGATRGGDPGARARRSGRSSPPAGRCCCSSARWSTTCA